MTGRQSSCSPKKNNSGQHLFLGASAQTLPLIYYRAAPPTDRFVFDFGASLE
jgi:hypothetical protein